MFKLGIICTWLYQRYIIVSKLCSDNISQHIPTIPILFTRLLGCKHQTWGFHPQTIGFCRIYAGNMGSITRWPPKHRKPVDLYQQYHFLVGGWATPLKNMSSSVGMISNPIYAKIKHGNQTTNQFCISWYITIYFFTVIPTNIDIKWHKHKYNIADPDLTFPYLVGC